MGRKRHLIWCQSRDCCQIKLEGYGVKGKVWKWIKDFLSNRKMRVSVRGVKSEWTAVTSGVPQGSVLGPTLFLVYVNDIPEAVESMVKLFADDTKLYKKIDSESDREIIQSDKLDTWSDDWLLRFNVDKCKRMHLGSRNTGQQYVMRHGEEEKILEEIKEEKDLGVWITNDLKRARQCQANAQRGMNIL